MRALTIVVAAGLMLSSRTGLAQTGQPRRPLNVSVASSLSVAMEEVRLAYVAQRPDVAMTFNFGASGSLQQQIEQGAPADVFLPAASRQMDALEKQGLITKGTRRDLLVNQVVLIAPLRSEIPTGFEQLSLADVKLIALGDPQSVPAGEYGKQVLVSMKLWPLVEPKLILAKDVRQVLTYIESGNADAGIVYASDAQASGKVRIASVAKAGSHKPIVYPVAVLRDASDVSLANDFITFLTQEQATSIFRKFGFLPGGTKESTSSNASPPLDLSPLWISIKTSAVATLLTFFLGLLVAVRMIRYQGKGKELIDGVLTLPLVLPPTVIGYFLLLLFGRTSILGTALEKIGLTIAFSWPATVIAATVVAFPLMYRTSRGAMELVSPNLIMAARTLGASEWRVLRSVIVPLAWPGIMAGTVLAFARALGEFGATLMLAGNIPGRTQTMPVAIFFASEGGDMNRALGWVILIVAVSLGVIAALNYRATSNTNRGDVLTGQDLSASEAPTVRYRVTQHATSQRTGELTFTAKKKVGGFNLDTSFEHDSGTLGLLGASGSGKSMALRCLAGIEIPDSGRIVLNGRVLFDSELRINVAPSDRRVGFLFQDYALFPHLTVRENIEFGLRDLPVNDREARVNDVIGLVRLSGMVDRLPGELSGGQKQRAALARALAIQPDALLLDEPFSALDPHLRRQLEEQLREALTHYQGVVVFVTHDLEEAFRFCQDLLVLDAGKLLAHGARHELFDAPRSTRTARLTGCKNVAQATLTSKRTIRVSNWNCDLLLKEDAHSSLSHVGIRAHHLRFIDPESEATNAFPCWLVEISESPHELTLYLHLHRPPEIGDSAHLQIEIAKEDWPDLNAKPQPWQVCLPPNRLLVLSD